ncbi:hypothetical protein B0H21DRAFT_691211 [Amylocystis lapponica]|nr:hypothetical protein B0H21DRAFT_691211 [Amylocystis lapponica]
MNNIVEYETITFNGTLDYPSIYRGPPSPEIDAAWDRLSDDGKIISITKEDLLRMGKADRPSLVRFQESDGGGYMAGLELPHQLHCVNLLRKYSYREHYASSDVAFQDSPETFRTHLDHCIEILRQNLMCRGDTGLVTFEWVAGRTRPYPDFNTVHRCRNSDKILAWGAEHTVHVPLSRLTRSKDTVDLSQEP